MKGQLVVISYISLILSYVNTIRYIGTSSTRVTPSAKGPIWMSNVVCSSADTSFDRCPFAGWGVNQCDHSTDVHIQCEGIVAVCCVHLAYHCMCVRVLALFIHTVWLLVLFFSFSSIHAIGRLSQGKCTKTSTAIHM